MLLYHVLHMLHRLQLPALVLHGREDLVHQGLVSPVPLLYLVVRLLDGRYNLLLFVGHHAPISFLNPHTLSAPYECSSSMNATLHYECSSSYECHSSLPYRIQKAAPQMQRIRPSLYLVFTVRFIVYILYLLL